MKVDAVVVGSGFGGLGAALALAERGRSVVVCEALRYPGGCAGRFTHLGRAYDAGATMGTGLDDDGVFGRLLAVHAPELPRTPLRPVLEVRAGDVAIEVPDARDALVDALAARSDAPPGLRAFFAEQAAMADAGWALLAGRPRAPVLTLARTGLRSLGDRMRAHGVWGFAPLRALAEALCRITVQVPPDEAEAPFALSALDYPFRGVRHLPGGLGTLAEVAVRAIRAAGGEVRLSDRVRAVRREGGRWRVVARSGELLADSVFANVAPHSLPSLAGVETPRLRRLAARVETGAGAAALFLALDRDRGVHHLDLTADPRAPTTEGNHVLCSVHGDTAVVTTHVPAAATGDEIAAIQERMRATVRAAAPEVWSAVTSEFTASPRTWARFTFRPGGWVGGVPRRVGLGAYAELVPRPFAPGLWLVGDAVLFGQSTLATWVSGQLTARASTWWPRR